MTARRPALVRRLALRLDDSGAARSSGCAWTSATAIDERGGERPDARGHSSRSPAPRERRTRGDQRHVVADPQRMPLHVRVPRQRRGRRPAPKQQERSARALATATKRTRRSARRRIRRTTPARCPTADTGLHAPDPRRPADARAPRVLGDEEPAAHEPRARRSSGCSPGTARSATAGRRRAARHARAVRPSDAPRRSSTDAAEGDDRSAAIGHAS